MIHKLDPLLKGMQIHGVHPVKFGGSPTEVSNKIPLTPKEHAQYTTREVLQRTEQGLNIEFPLDYRLFIEEFNGAEGEIGPNSYVVFWSLIDIIELNEACGVNEFAPGLVLIGSDGGDAAYAFDNRDDSKAIVEVPFIGMELDEVKTCANTFLEFLEFLYKL
ncbi:SMI1/KNR4 family protein [Clostridium estertheticum]|uniref:SMI1/KNR4 family protein n=1 Tax=Clostridium estertheticum TaxID=238834 RepID=UPI001C7D36CC|nr:SMI1/KNR4 family protein [Clostridium estertheticum]MBX4262452.1 SMI1/KNR4 family protein [Clostridium estertheticum]WLC72240.1 SMI1/KNR4 family protein [Clostridium estertheticum]